MHVNMRYQIHAYLMSIHELPDFLVNGSKDCKPALDELGAVCCTRRAGGTFI